MRKLLKGKTGISEDDIDEMIKEYKELHLKNVKALSNDVIDNVVYYHGNTKNRFICKVRPYLS